MNHNSLLFFIIGCVLTVQAQAQRETLDFNDNWYFLLGNRPWMTQPLRSEGGMREVDLPHDWSIELSFDSTVVQGDNTGYLAGGQGWYRKRFQIPESDKTKRIIIEFDGIYMNSTVYINGVWLGHRPFGYIGFDYDLTPYLNYGDEDNVLAVLVDNSDQPNSRWYSGSGIYRNVKLIKTSKIYMPQNGCFVYVKDVDEKSAKVHWEVELINEFSDQKEVTVVAQIQNKDGKQLTQVKKSIRLDPGVLSSIEFDATVENQTNWSPDNPKLYMTNVSIYHGESEMDNYETMMGFRDAHFDADRGFILNGESLKIKGVCLHHDGGAVGAAVPAGIWKRRLKLLKEMGANAVRTSHNPFAPEFYELCDQMGLMVMDEVFDEWTVPTLFDIDRGYHLYWEEWHEQDLSDFVRRDRNHPSVIIWSVGNEIIESDRPWGKDLAKKLVDICHELDPTRPVTCGINQPVQANKTGFFEEFDVVGYNYAPMNGLYASEKEKYPNRKFIGTESTQGLSTRGVYHFSENLRKMDRKHPSKHISAYAQDYRKVGHEGMWRSTNENDFVSGCFIWTGIDYLGESVIGWPSRSADFGTMDLCGFPKDDYYWFQSQWTEEPMLHILPHWNWPDKMGEKIPVQAYTNCDKVELFLNGKSLGMRAFKDRQDRYYFLEWMVAYRPGTLEAVGYKGGKEVVREKISTSGEPAKMVLGLDHKILAADGDDVAHVTIRFEDKNGITVPTADNEISLEVQGAGKLKAVDNGDPTLLQSFQANTIPAFNGLALAIVQAGRESGKIKVIARSNGLPDEELTITVSGNKKNLSLK